jgi:hypothetical protein
VGQIGGPVVVPVTYVSFNDASAKVSNLDVQWTRHFNLLKPTDNFTYHQV